MKRFKKVTTPTRYGWSDWIFPTDKYLMKCCDCGLVHQLEFRTFAETRQKRGAFEVVRLPWPIRVMFRARRVKSYDKAQG